MLKLSDHLTCAPIIGARAGGARAPPPPAGAAPDFRDRLSQNAIFFHLI
jgi:hypothetical protein